MEQYRSQLVGNGEIHTILPTALSLTQSEMSRFLGEYGPNITEGSRIALPKKLRKYIRGDEVVLSKGFEKCVFIYDKEDWVNLAQKRVQNPRGNVSTEELERYLYTSATESPIDEQGRLVIPASLLKYAEITKESAVLGVGDHIEVWNRSNWKEYLENTAQELSTDA